MQTETLSQIKQQIVSLDPDSKKHLAVFLAGEIAETSSEAPSRASDEERRLQTEWLKENREQYAGKFVALSGLQLVGEGTTLEAARTQATEHGSPGAFVTYVFSKNDEAFGGW